MRERKERGKKMRWVRFKVGLDLPGYDIFHFLPYNL